ncbi:hypothetical protein FOMPIDRAFT_1048211 [Fomitopsis schrenkii]|uniref:Man1/Src1-like C-terminal domain-containing protein n=1 Tax=Fomitopsis schrenkii TaxID=2126942 RepID=S8FUK9_FOMSC|nr:hypothetical protein FOMPIDRAFT_1048211 [Fomitopsis schrenkii]
MTQNTREPDTNANDGSMRSGWEVDNVFQSSARRSSREGASSSPRTLGASQGRGKQSSGRDTSYPRPSPSQEGQDALDANVSGRSMHSELILDEPSPASMERSPFRTPAGVSPRVPVATASPGQDLRSCSIKGVEPRQVTNNAGARSSVARRLAIATLHPADSLATSLADSTRTDARTVGHRPEPHPRDDTSGPTKHAPKHSVVTASGGVPIAAVVAFVLLFVPILSLILMYKKESTSIGFCDTGSTTNSVLEGLRERVAAAGIPGHVAYGTEGAAEGAVRDAVSEKDVVNQDVVKLVLSSLLPDGCTPCPDNAICTISVVMCERGFTIAPHPILSLVPSGAISTPSMSFSRPEGLRLQSSYAQAVYFTASIALDGLPGVGPVALPPQCVEDAERARRLRLIRETVINVLSEERGRRACRARGASSHGEEATLRGMSEAQRWGLQVQVLESELARHLPNDWMSLAHEFLDELVWAAQLPTDLLVDRDIREVFVASVEQRLTWDCWMKLHSADVWAHHKYLLLAGFVVPLALWWLWRHHRAAAADKERLTAVVKSVLAKLIEQARNHAHNPAAPPYLASVRLRDELLYDEQTLSYRQRIWGRVEKVIGINSNVRTSLEEMGDGDEMIVWTWIGSL